MNPRLVRAFTVGAITVGAVTMAHAQQVDVGKYEYDSHCAICHGSSGTGLDLEPYWSYLGAARNAVGIESGVVSGVINLESPGVEAPGWRPRHEQRYHEA